MLADGSRLSEGKQSVDGRHRAGHDDGGVISQRATRRTRLAAFAATLLALFLTFAPALAAPTFPALTGRVVDEAGIIPAATEVSLEQKLKGLEDATGDQLVVVTLKSLQGYEIADYGYQLGRAWQIGEKGKDNGVLLIVAPNEHDVRIEVGYGLEGDLTDAVSRLIIEQSILPKFRAGDMAAGIAAGTDDIIKVLSGDAAAYKQKAEQQPKTYAPNRPDGGSLAGILPFLIIVFFIIVFANRGRRGIWWGGLGGLGGGMGSGGWSSGSGGGWSGGGGFSGGGGSFGGGGASGHW
jgi:uncharacterized protein